MPKDNLNIEFLDFTNFRDHPTQENAIVFHYYEKERFDYFVNLLVKEGIWHETDVDRSQKVIYYVGTKRVDFKRTEYLNNLTIGKHRNKFIADRNLRILVFIISAAVLTLAILGAIKAS